MAQEKTARVPVTPLSKLRPPHVRHAEITRSDLLDDQRLVCAEVLVIAAPAGYGKSTLAIQWASRSARPVAWATLDESDNDPIVLLNTLSAALSQANESFVPVPNPSAEEPDYSRYVLPGFASAVANLNTAVTVVLDDTHTVVSPTSTRLLRTLVDAAPPGSQVAFVGRSVNGIPLPLWRGQGRVIELNSGDLAFNPAETVRAVHDFGGSDGEAVHAASGGWPVAVFLLSQAPSQRSLTNISEFIESEVLNSMDPELRDFVMCTAALGAVNTELARAATGSDRAGQYLSTAITTVLMCSADGGWYRHHPLLQETVLDLWQRTDPGRLRSLQAVAARWHLQQGFIDTAVTYAIASQDGPTLGDVIWTAAMGALLQGRTQTVLGWLAQIDPATIDTEPELSMAAAWAHVAVADYAQVLRYAQQTMLLMPPDWLEHPNDFSIGPSLALLMAVSQAGLDDESMALELAKVACAGVTPGDPLFPLTLVCLGFNQALCGDPAAVATLREAEALSIAAPTPSTHVEALCILSWTLLAAGDEQQGCDYAQRALTDYASRDLGQMNSTTALIRITEVALASHRGGVHEIEQAIARQQTYQPEVERVFAWYRPMAGGVLAFASARLGDDAACREYLSWCRTDGLCQQWANKAQQEQRATSPLRELTPAELRVWELLKSRMTLHEIAGTLYLSRETVKSHTGSIYRKLGVASRREAQELAESWI